MLFCSPGLAWLRPLRVAAALLEADHPSRSFGLLTIRRRRLEMK